MNDNLKGAKKPSNDMQLSASLVFSKGIKSAGEEHEERERERREKWFLTRVKNGLFVIVDINCHGGFL